MQFQHLIQKVTDNAPNKQIKIANGKYLEIVQIGGAQLDPGGALMEPLEGEQTLLIPEAIITNNTEFTYITNISDKPYNICKG